jgi:hypothetical protein
VYISRILTYRDKLAHRPQKLLKDKVIAHILIGLVESWNTIATVIENQPPKSQTLDNIVNTLNTHERKLATQATQAAQITKQVNTLLAHQQGKGSQRKGCCVNKPYQKQSQKEKCR